MPVANSLPLGLPLGRPLGLPLVTPSLRLRHFVPADAPVMRELNGEVSTRAWLPSHVYPTMADAVAALQYLIGCYADPGHPMQGPYVLAVDHAATQRVLGHVGFSPLDGEVEVSYAIAESDRGHGYGAEALLCACRWVAEAFSVHSVIAITAHENLASRRLLDSTGFVHQCDEVVRFQGRDGTIVSRYRRDDSSIEG